jgi:hypothetical protein
LGKSATLKKISEVVRFASLHPSCIKHILIKLKKSIMEKFMLIFHSGGTGNSNLTSPEAMQAHMGKWMAWVDRLRKEDIYVSGEPLVPGGKLVSGAGGKTVTDGPYTEGKEIVGGFFIVKAEDINQAAEIAKDCPDFEYGGTVQVRQVMKM